MTANPIYHAPMTHEQIRSLTSLLDTYGHDLIDLCNRSRSKWSISWQEVCGAARFILSYGGLVAVGAAIGLLAYETGGEVRADAAFQTGCAETGTSLQICSRAAGLTRIPPNDPRRSHLCAELRNLGDAGVLVAYNMGCGE